MVKLSLKKKSSEDSSAAAQAKRGDDKKASQGISAKGNLFRESALVGLLIIVVPALLACIFLAFIRAPSSKQAIVEQVAQSYAAQQAASVSREVEGLRARLNAAAQSAFALRRDIDEPTASATAEFGELAQLEAQLAAQELKEQRETALRAYFPGALSLRFIPLSELGTARLDDGQEGLRNLIEVDLVRRASNGEGAVPEAYQYEGQWLLSLAQAVVNESAPSQRAVLLVSFGKDTIDKLLAFPPELSADTGVNPGAFILEQRVYSGNLSKDLPIATLGIPSGLPAQQSDVPSSTWRVVFEPSAELASALESTVSPDYDAFAMSLLFALVGLFATVMLIQRRLDGELERVSTAGEHRSSLEFKYAGLVPVAQQFRKLSVRRARGDVGGSANVPDTQVPASTSAAMTMAEGPAINGLPDKIFRAYDIRGHAEEELDDETVYRIGAAIATIAGEMGEQTLVVGCDGRNSSGRIKGVIEKAVMQTGRDVLDIGLVSTPLLYYATKQSNASSGIMVTGSHNPPEHNGFKVVLKGQTIAEGTIDRVKNLALSGKFSKGKGSKMQHDVISEYLDEIIGDIAIAMPLRVVVDAGNGALSRVAPTLLEEMGCEVIPLYCEVDGDFPNRSPDTSNEENLSDLVREVIDRKADFGVAFDGDGDRLAVVTGSGRILRTDLLMMVFAKDVLSRNPGADVVYDVKCSRNLAQLVTSLGGRPVLWKTGHALMKQKMLETGALFGGEFSGHIFFGERWYGFDDGLYATGRLAEILASQGQTLDELAADLPLSVSTPEILVPVDDSEKFALMDRFAAKAKFPDGKVTDIDGLRVDFGEGWGLLRASNTSDALTARFEADDAAALEHIRTQFRHQLASVAPDLNIPF
ncbi:MAG: phosphomannomutase/phosphoglucomutase [Pseudomonadota bacterium]